MSNDVESHWGIAQFLGNQNFYKPLIYPQVQFSAKISWNWIFDDFFRENSKLNFCHSVYDDDDYWKVKMSSLELKISPYIGVLCSSQMNPGLVP